MKLLEGEAGLGVFAIVMALAAYTQTASNRLRDLIKANGDRDDIPKIKRLLALISAFDFSLVILGWIVTWNVFVLGQSAPPFSGVWWWSICFSIAVTGLALLHVPSWQAAARWLLKERRHRERLAIPPGSEWVCIDWPANLSIDEHKKIHAWLNGFPLWTGKRRIEEKLGDRAATFCAANVDAQNEEKIRKWLAECPLLER